MGVHDEEGEGLNPMRGAAHYYTTDIGLMHDIGDATIIRAVANALGMPSSAVGVADAGTEAISDTWDRPDVRAVVVRSDMRRYPYSEPTEWPINLAVTVASPNPVHEIDILRAIAAGLQVPLVGSVSADEHQDAFRLVFPDGDAPIRYESDDGDIELTASDRRRIALYDARARAA